MTAGTQLRWRVGGTAVLAVVVAAMVALLLPAPAAATAYRYWTYWTGTDAGWTFSQTGPASTVPGHGAVEGWRFAVSTGTRGQGSQPRISPSSAFDRFCGAAPAPAGQKRVAVVFDFGEGSDAPEGQQPPQARGTCVTIDRGATGGEILARAADVRIEGGLVCAIGGYPAGECAPAVATPTPSATKTRPPDRDPGRDPRGDRREPKPADTDPATPRPGAVDPDPTTTPKPGTETDDKGNTSKSPSPTATRSATPSASENPGTLPAAAPPGPTTGVLFTAADAHVDDESAPRWGLAAAVLALAALGAFLLLRRRPARGKH